MARSSDSAQAAVWRERFSRLAASGMTTAEFCAAERVTPASFYAWRRRLGLVQPRRRQRPAFQQVVVKTAPALAAYLPGGVKLEACGAQESALRAIVRELVRATTDREAS
jgi:hypothetical protein